VLLIICDGMINDMQASIDAIVQASRLPLSIVIVGVGNADFADMNTLDGDDVTLRDSKGNTAVRDIVQFVPFRKYGVGRFSELAKEVLAEIPDQFLGYMTAMGLVPNAARQAQIEVPPQAHRTAGSTAGSPPSYEESKQATR
jgi:hypothetical protein